MSSKETKFMFLAGFFVMSILVANTLASKLFVFGNGWVMTAGIVAFPITFLITDIVNDVWGRMRAHTLVLVGLAANVGMLILYQIGIHLTPAAFWAHQSEFAIILGAVPRIVLASMTAYLISQTWDVYVFDRIKKAIPLGLWFRNCISTVTSQAVDSAVFLGIAFWGVMALPELAVMYVTYLGVKAVIAVIDTPLAYLGVWWVNKEDPPRTHETGGVGRYVR